MRTAALSGNRKLPGGRRLDRRLLVLAALLCAGARGGGCSERRSPAPAAALTPDALQLGWVERAGGEGLDEGRAIAAAPAGRVVVVGGFTGRASFGGGEASGTVLDGHAGSRDAFVAKLNGNGTLAWAVSAGGAGLDEASGVAVDPDGGIRVGGMFSGTATFGTGNTRTTLSSAGESDLFLARYDPEGSLVWAVQAGGPEADVSSPSVGVDAAGNTYLAGVFFGTITFGSPPASRTLTSAGLSDLFLAKYDADGRLLWARRDGGERYDGVSALAVDAAGHAWLTGQSGDGAIFGAGEAHETTLTGLNAFVARYEPDGSLAWARQSEGGDLAIGRGIAVDAAGDCTVAGSFFGDIVFGAGTLQTTLISAGQNDAFIVRYDPDGVLLSARRDGGVDNEWATGVALDAAGNATVTGVFTGTATFGAGEVGETSLPGAGDLDVFVAQYGPDGLLRGARGAGGPFQDYPWGVAVDAAGHATVTGHFGGIAPFETGVSVPITVTSAGEEDVFVARYGVTVMSTPTGLCAGDGMLVTIVVENTPDLDVAEIDHASVRLAGASAKSCSFVDADADGDYDLACRFRGRDFDLGPGSVVAVLTGTTVVGPQILGDPVRLFRCDCQE
jgi:hypothetical protein